MPGERFDPHAVRVQGARSYRETADENIHGQLSVWRGGVRSRGTVRQIPELSLLALPQGERDRAFQRGDRQGRGALRWLQGEGAVVRSL